MSDVTDEDLLRLAREAWPDEDGLRILESETDAVSVEDGYGFTQACVKQHPRATEALYAALLVLAGELDVRALWRELALRREELSELGKDYNNLIEVTIPALIAERDHLREELAQAGRTKGER